MSEGVVELPAGVIEVDERGLAAVVASRCTHCHTEYVPHVDVCQECLGSDFSKAKYYEGRLHSFTEVHVLPDGFPETSVVGYVDLGDGARIFGHFAPGLQRELSCDMRVAFDVGAIFADAEGKQVVSYRFVVPDVA